MNDNMLRWLLTGEVGASSKAMAAHLCGFPCCGDWPSDPDDFARCLMFLDTVPEARAELHRMAEVNRQWAALVARWDELETTFRSEMITPRVWYSAPKTLRLMREIINQAGKAGKEAKE